MEQQIKIPNDWKPTRKYYEIKKEEEPETIERVYYEIDEALAEEAYLKTGGMYYKPGTVTAQYRKDVDKMYDFADAAIEMQPKAANKIAGLAWRYASKMKGYYHRQLNNDLLDIPEALKQKKEESSKKDFDNIQNIFVQIDVLSKGEDYIQLDGKLRLKKLKEDLKKFKKSWEYIKKVRHIYTRTRREHKSKQWRAKQLDKIGFDEYQREQVKIPGSKINRYFSNQGIKNAIQRVKRKEVQIEKLESCINLGRQAGNYRNFSIIEDDEISSLQIHFKKEPDEKIQELLKEKRFHYHMVEQCWQQPLRVEARKCAKELKEELLKMYKRQKKT